MHNAARPILGLAAFFIGQPIWLRLRRLNMEVKLYVGNLSYETSEDELRALFGQAGAIASVAIIKDRDTGRSKGFAFVEMTTQSDAQKAIGMYNGYKVKERELTVNLARPREERSGFGGSSFNRSGAKHKPRGGNRNY